MRGILQILYLTHCDGEEKAIFASEAALSAVAATSLLDMSMLAAMDGIF
jgi:hypothetical protein